VTIRELTTLHEMREAGQLFIEVWKTPGGCPEISADLLQALQLAGSYIAGAFEAGAPERLAGASVAFGSVRAVPEPPELHSHLTATAKGRLSTGVGFALKLHQRAWALERGIGTITWTFDPLVRRNSVFNLAKLGACATAYLRDIYGSLTDVLNAGGESDRLWARWEISDPAVAAAAAGKRRLVSGDSLPYRLRPGDNLRPHLSMRSGRRSYKVSVPPDIEALRRADRVLANEWRVALRDVLGATLEAGGRLLGIDGEGDFVVEEAPELEEAGLVEEATT